METTKQTILNGIDTEAVKSLLGACANDAKNAQTHWHVLSQWKGGTRSDAKVDYYEIGGQRVAKDFTIPVDEPLELGGTNQFANPQETLLAALNACMIAHYSIAAAMKGVALEELSIETEGDIDIRGFLGLEPSVKPGYDSLSYRVRMKGDGTREQFEEIHDIVSQLSPNRFNIANPIRLEGELIVD
ncbi:MAG: OsmC family protein [Planctomycetota bacterium]